MRPRPFSETAHLAAAYRAIESARGDALFSDPFARILAGERGPELARGARGAAVWERGIAVRTRTIDDLLFGVFAEHAVDVVVNLGAGLDARPYRLEVPAHVRWIEADGAAILEEKRALLAPFEPRCTVERVSLDLTDGPEVDAFLAAVADGAHEALAITEGVLAYLRAAEVEALARRLRATAPFRWWILDHPTPIQRDLVARAWSVDAEPSEGAYFAPEDVAAFFGPCGWRVARACASADAAAAFGRAVAPAEAAELLPLMPALAEPGHARSGYVLLQPEG